MTYYFYSNTGFNSVDIPDSLSLVKNRAHRVLTKTNGKLLQVDNLYQLTVKDISREDARNVDYVIIKDDNMEAGYFLDDRKPYEYSSTGIVTFYLQLDPYATLGSFNLISGSANRLSIKMDEEDNQWFTLPEPFRPSMRPAILERSLDPRMQVGHNNINLLETLVIPPKTLKDNETTTEYDTGRSYNDVQISMPSQATRQFESSGTNQEVLQTKEKLGEESDYRVTSTTVNDIQVFEYREMKETNLFIKGFYNDIKSIQTGSRWWRGDQLKGIATIKGQQKSTTVLNDLRITGSDGNTTAYWSVPAPYIESSSGTVYQPQEITNYGGLDSITSSIYESGDDTTVITGQYNLFGVKNNKTKYCQSTSIIVYSPVTGNKLEKQWYEIINPSIKPREDVYKAAYRIGADIRPQGNPIFQFKYFNGETPLAEFGYIYSDLLVGGNWRQIPLSAQGSNVALNQLALNNQKQESLRDLILSGASSAALIGIGIAGTVPSGGMSNVLTAAGVANASMLITKGTEKAGDAFKSYIGQSFRQQDQQELLNAQGMLPSSSLSYSSSDYVREMGYNTFYLRFLYYNLQDIQAYDKFLTMYGYNVGNKPLTEEDFDSRPGFNYVRINDINIKSNKGNWLIERVKEQLKAGVRIWHELPNEDRIAEGNK